MLVVPFDTRVALCGTQNSPLYLRTFDDEEDLGLHYIAHVSLDIIEEKMRSAGVLGSRDDMYLGFLGPIEDYRVYKSCLPNACWKHTSLTRRR